MFHNYFDSYEDNKLMTQTPEVVAETFEKDVRELTIGLPDCALKYTLLDAIEEVRKHVN